MSTKLHPAVRSTRAWLLHALLLVATCAVVAACGGSSHSSGHTSRTSTTSTGLAFTATSAKGPGIPLPARFRNLDARVAAQIAKQQHGLSHVTVSCPATSKLPVKCTMSAIQAGLPGITASQAAKNKVAAALKRPHTVAGTVQVQDVNPRTGLYDLTLQYGLKR